MSLIRRISCPRRNGYYDDARNCRVSVFAALRHRVLYSADILVRACMRVVPCPRLSVTTSYLRFKESWRITGLIPSLVGSAASNLVLFASIPVMHDVGIDDVITLCVWSCSYLAYSLMRPAGDVNAAYPTTQNHAAAIVTVHLKGAI